MSLPLRPLLISPHDPLHNRLQQRKKRRVQLHFIPSSRHSRSSRLLPNLIQRPRVIRLQKPRATRLTHPVITIVRIMLSANEAELGAASASDRVAAIAELDLLAAEAVGAELVVFAPLEAVEGSTARFCGLGFALVVCTICFGGVATGEA